MPDAKFSGSILPPPPSNRRMSYLWRAQRHANCGKVTQPLSLPARQIPYNLFTPAGTKRGLTYAKGLLTSEHVCSDQSVYEKTP